LYAATVLGTTTREETALEQLNAQFDEAQAHIARQADEERLERILAAQAEAAAAEEERKRKAEEAAEAEARRKAEEERRTARAVVTAPPASVASISVEATYYTAFCDTGCIGITATGIDVSSTIYHKGLRVIAVDPAVIPLGSVVQVTAGGETFRAIAGDTGGAIKGHRIDILVGSHAEAMRNGRVPAKVEIVK